MTPRPAGAEPPEAATALEKAQATAVPAADGLVEEDGWVLVGRVGQRVRRPEQGPDGPRGPGRPTRVGGGPRRGVHPNAPEVVRP